MYAHRPWVVCCMVCGGVFGARAKNALSREGGYVMARLSGKVAVITGANSGIGLATAKRFVEEGAHVVITGRRKKELDEAAGQIGKNVTAVQGDVSRCEELDRLYAEVKARHGPIGC